MSEAIITVEGLGKRYRITHQAERQRYVALRDVIAQKMKAPFHFFRRSQKSEVRSQRSAISGQTSDLRPPTSGSTPTSDLRPLTSAPASQEDFWALRNVSFDVHQGEVVGIIGRNGAGKTTLLKILSRITEPTTGRIRIQGRVASLLEVGTGFHPELTGRENIFLNGAILGMHRAEIKQKFDEIVAFSEVEKFLDTPVKRYSSGMYVRLAFAVAAHLEPEILIVDEVLAVGDAEFQKKCLGKMHDVSTSGRTVLFVSHNMQAISILCNRALHFDTGSITYRGDVQKTIQSYLRHVSEPGHNQRLPSQRPGSGEYRFTLARPTLGCFASSEEKVIQFQIDRHKQPVGRMSLSAHIVDSNGTIVIQCDSRLVGTLLEDGERYAGQLRFTTPWLKPGNYRVDLFICAPMVGIVDAWEAACSLTISPVLPYDHSASEDGTKSGVVFGDFAWEMDAPRNQRQPQLSS